MNEAAPIAAASAVPVYAPGPVPAVGGKIGVLLVNLGTPEAADAPAVRRYLKEFLSDPRVIENQGGSGNSCSTPSSCRPAAAQGARLRKDLEQRAERISAQDHHPVAGGKAWHDARAAGPAYRGRMGDAVRQSVDASRLAELSRRLRPHPGHAALSAICAATTATVCDEVFRALMRMRGSRRCALRRPTTTTRSISRRWRPRSRAELPGSFHARRHPRLVPRDAEGLCRQGRSLLRPCVKTTRLLREQLRLDETS